MIVQQVADVKPKKALVVADDTDVFALLLHFCCKEDIQASTSVLMVSPIHGRSMIDINATVTQHRDIIPNLLAAHGLTGCDTVAPYFGIGKSVALNVLRSGVHSLSSIGDTNCTPSDIMNQATQCILACYGQTKCMTMTEARQKMWAKKVSRSVASAPKLSSLPPTMESFAQNAACAHLQVAVWRNALEQNPPQMEPRDFGWTQVAGKEMYPTPISDGVALVPDALLKVVKCGCSGEIQCRTKRCGCRQSNLACSVFCACQDYRCFNEKTRQTLQPDEDEDDEDDDI